MMGKIIFSRKGFDSGKKTGNGASPFVRDGEMMNFPIPAERRAAFANLIPYGGIHFADGITMQQRMDELRRGGSGWGPSVSVKCCHHDPDLVLDARRRPSKDGWRGIFGQSGPQQTELEKVEVGDLFLFFGWFKEAAIGPDGLRFCRGARDLHALFGYLQVEEKWRIREDMKIPKCFSDHPHLTWQRMKLRRDGMVSDNDMVYIARERLSIPGVKSGLPGHGIFRHAPQLVLTAEGQPRSFWGLPSCFDDQFCDRHIIRMDECLCRPRCPTKECRRKGLWTTSTHQWQESIVNVTPEIQEWALERIRVGMGID